MSMKYLIPPKQRHLFDAIRNFNDLQLDTFCAASCLEVIAATNHYLEVLPEATPQDIAATWATAALQCDVIINS